jgi:hypothetical protein
LKQRQEAEYRAAAGACVQRRERTQFVEEENQHAGCSDERDDAATGCADEEVVIHLHSEESRGQHAALGGEQKE